MAELTDWVIDCGNTAVKWAIFQGDHCLGHGTDPNFNEMLSASGEPAGIAVAASGVVPAAISGLRERFPRARMALLTPADFQRAFPIEYSPALGLGLDRWANAASAKAWDSKGTVVVIDAGTCLTVEVVVGGTFHGGSISPGLALRLEAMASGTAALPDLSQDELPGAIDPAERSTRGAMLAGALGGMRLEIEGRLREFGKVWPDLTVLLTGGDASHLQLPEQYRIFADPLLTLKGIRIIYQALGDAQSPQYHP